jgi:hypothetical protein
MIRCCYTKCFNITLIRVTTHVYFKCQQGQTLHNRPSYRQREIIAAEFTCVKPESQSTGDTMRHFAIKPTARH